MIPKDMKNTDFQEVLEKKDLIGKSVIKKLENENWDDDFMRNLDDYAPTMSYLGYGDFIIEKVEKLITDSEYISHGLYTRDFNNLFVSWKNDEWLGGLIYLDQNFSSRKISFTLKTFLKSFSKAFVKNDRICSFSFHFNGRWFRYPSFSPRVGVVIEELTKLNNHHPIPDWEALLKRSFENKYFKKRGVFPNETFFEYLSFFNEVSEVNKISLSGFYLNKMLPTQKTYRPVKHNSSLLHALITGCRSLDSSFLHSKLDEFIEGFVINFITRKGLVGVPPLDIERGNFRLSFNHPVIDSLCDAYYFVEKNPDWLDTAEKVAEAWKKIRPPTNLFPESPNDPSSWLDDQIDIAISFGRLYELTDKEEYLEIAIETLTSVFDKHYSEEKEGLVERVDKSGNIIDSSVHPKYNALAIKAFIFLEKVVQGNEKIYSKDSDIHELLKDR